MPNQTLEAVFRLGLWSAVAASLMGGCALVRAAQRPATDYSVPRTPERVARGQYLVDHVLDCASCHGGIDPATKAADRNAPMVGGAVYGHAAGIPGEIPCPNITQARRTGIGAWTDGEIMRAVREGVDRHGNAIFPIMPYPEYATLSDEDAQAVVAYLRTLPPVEHEVPARKLDFPLNFVINFMPKPLHGAVKAPGLDKLSRGKYLATLAGCLGCHTQRDMRGQPKPGLAFAGGNKLHFVDQPANEPALMLPNITQDKATGIGAWTEAQVHDALTHGKRPDGRYLHTSMPWVQYSGLTLDDMDALVAWVRTIPPVKNKVTR